MSTAAQTQPTVPAHRHQPRQVPLRVLVGKDRFSENHARSDGPLVTHPRIVATAHTAALTSDYFAAASRRLGEALASYLDHQRPAGFLR